MVWKIKLALDNLNEGRVGGSLFPIISIPFFSSLSIFTLIIFSSLIFIWRSFFYILYFFYLVKPLPYLPNQTTRIAANMYLWYSAVKIPYTYTEYKFIAINETQSCILGTQLWNKFISHAIDTTCPYR